MSRIHSHSFLGRRFATCGLFLLVLTTGTASLGQQPQRERLAELESIRAQIARLQARLETVRSKRAGLAGELDQLEIRLQLQQQRIAEAVTARQLLQDRWETTQEKVQQLAAAEEAAREALRSSLVGLYRLGQGGYLRLGLSISSGSDLLQGIRQLRYFARRDASAFQTYLDTRARLSVERDELAAQRGRLDDWLSAETRRRAEMETLRARQRELLARTEREQADLVDRTRALRDKARKLAELLDALYGRNTAALGGRPIQDFRGALDWPAHGSVAAEFGPQRDPRYNTLIPHNGVDIATSSGEAVRAVYPGKVVFAANFQGYGLTVVIMHAERVFTLYAGLSSLEVQRGAVVSLDQQLGRASDRLYFEIRVRNHPENPRQWLR